MTDRRSPRPPGSHPEEALAAFADGSATPDERAAVLGHLQTCTTCRRDLETSRRALEALGTLPEPPSPTLDPGSIVRQAGNVVGLEPSEDRPRTGRGSRILAGGLAAGLVAAGLVLVLATGVLKLGGGGASMTAGGKESSAGSSGVVPKPAEQYFGGNVSADYSRQAIDDLAATEANQQAAHAPSSGATRDTTAQPDLLAKVQRCTEPQTADGSSPISVVLAHFEGRPVFVSVLRRGTAGSGFVRVVVTDRASCSVLYAAQAPIPQH
jgi:hypothetical protein